MGRASKIEVIDDNDDDDIADAPDSQASMMDAIGKIMGGGENNSTGLIVTMMMEQNRQNREDARERQREMQSERARQSDFTKQLMMALIPVAAQLFKKDVDPMMMKLLESKLDNSSAQEQMQAMLALANTNAQASLDHLKQMFVSVMETKDKLNEDALQRTRDMLDNDNREEPSAAVGIMREVREGLQAVAQLRASNAKESATNMPTVQTVAVNPGEPGEPVKQLSAPPVHPIALILRNIRALNVEKIEPKRRILIIAHVVGLIAQHDDLSDAILAEADDGTATIDADALQNICAPQVLADPVLAAWIGGDGVAAWLEQFLLAKVSPLLWQVLHGDDDDGEDDGPDDDEDDENEPAKEPARETEKSTISPHNTQKTPTVKPAMAHVAAASPSLKNGGNPPVA